ncbi:MAG: hypothetical protein R3A52_20430 [Polyangiales bacterium]
MGDAAKVIDWNGIDVPEGVVELLAELPPGRYRIAVAPDDTDDTLTDADRASALARLADLSAGRTFTVADADARMREAIANATR